MEKSVEVSLENNGLFGSTLAFSVNFVTIFVNPAVLDRLFKRAVLNFFYTCVIAVSLTRGYLCSEKCS